MIKKIGHSIAIQMLGTISSLILVWLITRLYGTAVQGEFVLIKSWVDMLIVISGFGMPQSFIYAINKLGVSWEVLEKYTLRYIPIALVVNLLLTFIWFECIQPQSFLSTFNYVFVAIGISCLTGFTLLRGLYLTQNDGSKFALITITPNILLLLSFLLLFLLCRTHVDVTLMYFFSGALSLLFIANRLGVFRKKNSIDDIYHVPWGILFSNGFNVFVQSVFSSLLPLGTYFLMIHLGFSSENIGAFSIAVYTYIVFTLPLSMVSPIFYNRWSIDKDVNKVIEEFFRFVKLGVVLIPVLFVAYCLFPIVLPFVFGPQIIPAINSSKLLLISVLALYFNNLFGNFFLSQGLFKLISYIFIFKVLSCFLFIILFSLIFNKSLDMIALGWLSSEYIALFIYCLFWRGKWSCN